MHTHEIEQVELVETAQLTSREAVAALWACLHARNVLVGARHIDALDAAIAKLDAIAGGP